MRLLRPLLIVLALGVLTGCTADTVPKAEPSFYRNLAVPGAQLDSIAAASMISGYRTNNGLPAVMLDPDLTRMAEAQATIMAKRDKTRPQRRQALCRAA